VRSPKARNKITTLPHDTSLFDTRAALPGAAQITEKDGLGLFSVPAGYDLREKDPFKDKINLILTV